MRHESSDIGAATSCTGVTDNQSVLTGMSHEMRTQMNAVVAFSFLLSKDEYAKEEREDFGNQILQACEQLIELFDNFLDSAIIDTGNSKAETKTGKAENYLEEILSEFRDTLRKDKYKDILLVTENQIINREDFLMDTGKIKRVIRNLFQISLSNTRSGYIKIGYNIRDGLFNFFILDSGMGYFKNREFFETSDLSASLSNSMISIRR
jgi:signal transduction histidine kinase